MEHEKDIQVTRVGDRYGALMAGNVVRTFDTLQEAITFAIRVREGTEVMY